MDLWTNFYHFCLVLNKLFNILHAFSICVLCLSKLVNYFKTKILFFSLELRKKGLKNRKGIAYRRQIEGYDQNIILRRTNVEKEHFPA